MGYARVDRELREPLPDLQMRQDQDGAAILLRLDGRPVHYSLHRLVAGTRLAGEEVWALTGRDAGAALLAGAIRDEIAPPPARASADVTVAVCTHGRPDLLADLLHSVLALRARRPELPILVVDNAPPDDATRDLVATLDGVRYTCEPRAGLDFARNKALQVATTEFVAFLDDDVVVDHGWLAGLEEALAENPDTGIVTGLVLPRRLDSPAQVMFERRGGFRRGVRKLRYDGQRPPGNPLYPVGAGLFGAGANMVVRRPLALGLGGFDEALDTGAPLPGGGDLDIFYRVIRAGWPLCYEPAMLVFHLHRPEQERLRRQYQSWGEGMMAFLEKTYEADPTQRLKIRGMVAWWLTRYSRTTLGGVVRRDRDRVRLDVAELQGGLVGLTGSYRRSRRRTQAIKDRHGDR